MFTESQDKAGVSERMTILWSPCCGRAVAAVAAPAQVSTSESVGPGEHKASTYSSSNLFQNVSPNDCSFNSSTGHSLRQDLRFFQVLKFNVILKHSISNSKFRTGHEFLFNVVLPIHSSCHSNLSKASMEWTKHRWLIVNLNLVSHRKQSASTETVTSWRKRETWRRWALIQNEYWLLHYCLQR